MNPQVLLIAKSDVDFRSLLKLSKDVLGRNISDGLDKNEMQVKDLSSFIALLDEFASEGSNPLLSLRDAGDLLKHIHFVFMFLVNKETYIELLETSELSFTTTSTIRVDTVCSIVSGNLQQWRTAIINLATGRESYYARLTMNAVLKVMEKSGLSSLWGNYTKQQMVDSSIRLIQGG